jgi:glycosyltransferase involved in cell wall biosynthesis
MVKPRTGTVLGRETIVFLGTYDKGKPRVRLLLEGAKVAGFRVHECHADIWFDVKDKSEISGLFRLLHLGFRWAVSQPRLVLSYCRAPTHKYVLIPYPGVFDLFILFPFIKCRRAKIYLDVFFSLYDTMVNDRQIMKSRNVVSKLIYALEWSASRISDLVFLDTESHAEYFRYLFHLSKRPIEYIPVGVETSTFERKDYSPWRGDRPLLVIFYGQFVPLQGTEILLDAISIWERSPEFPIHWTIIGEGQDSPNFDKRLVGLGIKKLRRVEWVPYSELPNWIREADVCCGIFGRSNKASHVIPNKVYQILGVGRPIITADTPAIRSLVGASPAVELVQPGNPVAIVEGLCRLGARLQGSPDVVREDIAKLPIIGAKQVGEKLVNILGTSSAD